MKRLLLIALIALALVACNLPAPTPTEEPGATDTPTVTLEVVTLTPSPSATITLTPTDTAVPVTPTSPNNLLANPGFEGSYRPVIFGEVNVAPDWEPFYCDEPYMDEKCPAPRQGTGNPPDLLMGRPEFKPIDFVNYPDRVWEGELAQVWFCFYRTCNAGVWQTFLTTPGEQYEVGAIVESWYNFDQDIESDLITADDWQGSVWWIGIDTNSDNGIDYAFDDSLSICEFPVDPNGSASQNHYDNWVHISCKFTAEGTTATVYYGNLRTWPVANNDNYIDGAYAIQLTGIPDDQPTPTPIATPNVTSTPEPTATPNPVLDTHIILFGESAVYRSDNYPMTIRYTHSINGAAVDGLAIGKEVPAVGRWIGDNGDRWACVDPAAMVVQNPDYPDVLILECRRWVAMSLGTTIYGNIYE